jgi:DNA polymerase III delta subunit
MEKLLLYIHPRKVIEKEDVEEVLGEGAGGGVFDLTKAIRERNLAEALSILAKLLERGEIPLRIHSLITREMRILLRIKEKGEKISSQEACTIIFGPRSYYPPFYTKIASDYIRAVRKFDFSDLITSYQYLVETEASIKTGREEPDLAIERMILHLLQPTHQ